MGNDRSKWKRFRKYLSRPWRKRNVATMEVPVGSPELPIPNIIQMLHRLQISHARIWRITLSYIPFGSHKNIHPSHGDAILLSRYNFYSGTRIQSLNIEKLWKILAVSFATHPFGTSKKILEKANAPPNKRLCQFYRKGISNQFGWYRTNPFLPSFASCTRCNRSWFDQGERSHYCWPFPQPTLGNKPPNHSEPAESQTTKPRSIVNHQSPLYSVSWHFLDYQTIC